MSITSLSVKLNFTDTHKQINIEGQKTDKNSEK